MTPRSGEEKSRERKYVLMKKTAQPNRKEAKRSIGDAARYSCAPSRLPISSAMSCAADCARSWLSHSTMTRHLRLRPGGGGRAPCPSAGASFPVSSMTLSDFRDVTEVSLPGDRHIDEDLGEELRIP
ncbi:MAG: hypothetical protein MZV70_02550 [Desulfobacterales bacterium]|nr:hypothetical protein [Desulfobacterales bacterium]